MTNRVRNFMRGMGSLLNVWPRTDYGCFLSASTPEEQMKQAWREVRNDIHCAFQQVKNEQTRRKL